MKSLEDARSDLHAQHCQARNLHYLVQTQDLEVVYRNATPERKALVLTLISDGEIKAVRRFIKKELLELTPFHRIGIIRLRQMAKRLRIVNYHTLRKQTLVEEITNEVERIKKNAQ